MVKTFQPDDLVFSCPLLERGIRFWNKGIVCCSAVTLSSPVLVTPEEMRSGKVNYDLIVKRRKRLFEAFNGLNDMDIGGCAKCALLQKKPYKDVDLTRLGGLGGSCMASSFNISHFSKCNLRCRYCDYTIRNDFVPPQYDNIIEIIEEFRKRDKLLYPNSIDYNGGEPTLLENFDEILNYLVDNNIGYTTVYSNCLKYKQSIFDALKQNKIGLITSLDAGTPSSYEKIHQVKAFKLHVETIIKYKQSGSDNLVVKYNICKENVTDDDLYGFVFLMAAINPPHVFICPEFPYGDMVIPEESVKFGAKMHYLLRKYTNIPHIYIQTDDMKGDPKLIAFSSDIRKEIEKLENRQPITQEFKITPSVVSVCGCEQRKKKKLKWYQKIFSVYNEPKHKVICLLGIKAKIRHKKKGIK